MVANWCMAAAVAACRAEQVIEVGRGVEGLGRQRSQRGNGAQGDVGLGIEVVVLDGQHSPDLQQAGRQDAG